MPPTTAPTTPAPLRTSEDSTPAPQAARPGPPRHHTHVTAPLTTRRKALTTSTPALSLMSAVIAVAMALAAPPGPAHARRGDYAWPLAPPHPVLRTFTAPTTPYGQGHRGVDLGGSAGEPVLAAGDGTVLFAGEVGGRPVVSVIHDDGLRTTYEPVTPTVRTGDRVGRGAPLGTLRAGHEGCPPPACLHWGARRGLAYVNPIRLVAPGRVRLLPATTPGRAPQR